MASRTCSSVPSARTRPPWVRLTSTRHRLSMPRGPWSLASFTSTRRISVENGPAPSRADARSDARAAPTGEDCDHELRVPLGCSFGWQDLVASRGPCSAWADFPSICRLHGKRSGTAEATPRRPGSPGSFRMTKRQCGRGANRAERATATTSSSRDRRHPETLDHALGSPNGSDGDRGEWSADDAVVDEHGPSGATTSTAAPGSAHAA